MADDFASMAEKIRNGDRAAIDTVYRQLWPELVGRWLLGIKAQDRDDTAQEILIRFFDHLPSKNSWSAWRSYVHRMTMRKIQTIFRQNRSGRQRGANLDLKAIEEEPYDRPHGTKSSSSDSPVLDRERLDAIRQCLELLPPGHAAMLLNHYNDGTSLSALAAMLGKKESSFRTKVFNPTVAEFKKCLKLKGVNTWRSVSDRER